MGRGMGTGGCSVGGGGGDVEKVSAKSYRTYLGDWQKDGPSPPPPPLGRGMRTRGRAARILRGCEQKAIGQIS